MEEFGFYKAKETWSPKVMKKVIKEAENDCESHLKDGAGEQGKDYLQKIVWRTKVSIMHPYLQLACDPALVSAAGSYFGYMPIIGNIHLWYSPNVATGKNLGSQNFHLDYADTRQFKVFIPIQDVSDTSGPTHLVNAMQSDQIQASVNYKLNDAGNRLSDEKVMEFAPKHEWIPLTGKSGSLFFADTSRCFHFGSRDGTTPRLLLMVQYLSPCAFTQDWNHKRSSIFAHLDNSSLPAHIRALIGAV